MTKVRPRFTVTKSGKVRTYNPKASEQAQEALAWTMKAALTQPDIDAVHTFGVRASFHNAGLQRRDVDNLLKLVMDAATGVVWKDDRQVSEIHAFSEPLHPEPSTRIVIYITGEMIIRTTACLGGCGKQLPTYPSWNGQRRFCGAECRRKKSTTRTIPCANCGRAMLVEKANLGRTKFCSRQCRATHKTVEIRCRNCNRPYRIPQSTEGRRPFCTKGCAIAYKREHPPSYNWGGTCETCGGKTSRREYTRCRACRTAAHTVNTSNYWRS